MAREQKRVERFGTWWEQSYCASCSKGPFGLVTADFASHHFYLCDDCYEKQAHRVIAVPGT